VSSKALIQVSKSLSRSMLIQARNSRLVWNPLIQQTFDSISCQIFSDPIVDSFKTMKTPLPFLVMFVVYLAVILKIAPAYMKNRKPMNISTLIRFYNVFQVAACTYLVVKFHSLGFSFRQSFQCTKNFEPGREKEIFNLSWWFLMLRVVELVETVFFILRKKQNQVSALHVYHHISTIAVVWLHLKFMSGKNDECD
jgi:elongation of very long chain fatty acids protein 1